MATSRSGAAKKKVTSKARSKTKTRTRARSAPVKAAPTLADLRRIARSIVTSTSVMDQKRMMSLYADNVESMEPGQTPVRGIEDLREKHAEFATQVSDQQWHARNLWVDGQTVIIEWEASLQMKKGGRRVALNELAIHEIRNGKIVRERFYYDPSVLG